MEPATWQALPPRTHTVHAVREAVERRVELRNRIRGKPPVALPTPPRRFHSAVFDCSNLLLGCRHLLVLCSGRLCGSKVLAHRLQPDGDPSFVQVLRVFRWKRDQVSVIPLKLCTVELRLARMDSESVRQIGDIGGTCLSGLYRFPEKAQAVLLKGRIVVSVLNEEPCRLAAVPASYGVSGPPVPLDDTSESVCKGVTGLLEVLDAGPADAAATRGEQSLVAEHHLEQVSMETGMGGKWRPEVGRWRGSGEADVGSVASARFLDIAREEGWNAEYESRPEVEVPANAE